MGFYNKQNILQHFGNIVCDKRETTDVPRINGFLFVTQADDKIL